MSQGECSLLGPPFPEGTRFAFFLRFNVLINLAAIYLPAAGGQLQSATTRFFVYAYYVQESCSLHSHPIGRPAAIFFFFFSLLLKPNSLSALSSLPVEIDQGCTEISAGLARCGITARPPIYFQDCI